MKKNGQISEVQSAFVVYQLLDSLDYIHKKGIVHRDLKLSNILIGAFSKHDDNSLKFHIKLCDFGLATEIEHPDEEHYTLCGTPNYIAPEIASQQAHGFPVDLWSVGCLFYSMVVGSLPFDQGDVKETLLKVISGVFQQPTHISDNAKNFLNSLLELVS